MANKPTERVLLEEEIKGYFSPVFLRQLLAASRSNRKPYVLSCQKIFGCNSLQFPKLSGFFPWSDEFAGSRRCFSAGSWVILLIATSWYINWWKTKLEPDNQSKMTLAWGSKRKNMVIWHNAWSVKSYYLTTKTNSEFQGRNRECLYFSYLIVWRRIQIMKCQFNNHVLVCGLAAGSTSRTQGTPYLL